MEENNMNQNADPASAQETGDKTFTQEEVNRIVTSRLSREREQTLRELNKKEQELAQREFRLNSRQKLIERGYPENLLDALNCSSEEAFGKAIDIIDSLIRERISSSNAREGITGFRAVGSASDHGHDDGVDPIRKAMKL